MKRVVVALVHQGYLKTLAVCCIVQFLNAPAKCVGFYFFFVFINSVIVAENGSAEPLPFL